MPLIISAYCRCVSVQIEHQLVDEAVELRLVGNRAHVVTSAARFADPL
jgi:hypothetical protein